MKLEGEQLVLDTNIFVHWLRGGSAAERLRATYEIGTRRPRPIVPVVVKGEIKSFARQRGWGTAKLEKLGALRRELPAADVSSEVVLDAYAFLDAESRSAGRRMGKNDLWIAAVARVLGAVVLTTDTDFDHLNPDHVRVERLDTAALIAT